MNPLLIVTTSHGELGTTGDRTGLWLDEFAGVYVRFMHHGIPVVVASPLGGEIPLDPLSLKVPALSPEARAFLAQRDRVLDRTVALSQIHSNDFDAVFYPGGHGPMWDLAANRINARLLGAFFACRKVVGAICHGPAALLKARHRNGESVLRNRRVTGFSDAEEARRGLHRIIPFSLEERIRAAGGVYCHREPWMRHVVVDNHLVTGQNPQSTVGVAETMLKMLIPLPPAVRERCT